SSIVMRAKATFLGLGRILAVSTGNGSAISSPSSMQKSLRSNFMLVLRCEVAQRLPHQVPGFLPSLRHKPFWVAHARRAFGCNRDTGHPFAGPPHDRKRLLDIAIETPERRGDQKGIMDWGACFETGFDCSNRSQSHHIGAGA